MRVSFNESKILKSLNFGYPYTIFVDGGGEYEFPIKKEVDGIIDPSGNWCYDSDGKLICPKKYNPSNKHYPAPLQYVVQKWLREEGGVEITITAIFDNNKVYYQSNVYLLQGKEYERIELELTDTYEKSLEKATNFALSTKAQMVLF